MNPLANPFDAATPMGLEIVKLGHPVLRQVAQEVPAQMLGTERLKTFVAQMIDTLDRSRGVGLAAPQVGVSMRIFLTRLPASLQERYFKCTPDPLRIWVNPSWQAIDDDTIGGMEGCLSIPHYVGRVVRPLRIKVTATDWLGQPIQATLEGWNARVFMHEHDHLEGILYLDRIAKDDQGHPEIYASEQWAQTEHDQRLAKNGVWLNQRSLSL